MDERTHRNARNRAELPSERLQSLLVPIDLTPGSDRVLGRVALLPLTKGARVMLLHAVPESLPRGARRNAERDAKSTLAEGARTLTKALSRRVVVEPVVKIGSAASEIASLATSMNAELVVMGRGHRRGLRDAFLGSTAERVIRRGQLPVLVVRLPARVAYQRPALALNLDAAAHEAVVQLLRIVPPPRPRLTIIHAYDIPYRGFTYPSLTEDDADDYRDHYRQKASQELERLLATALARANVPPQDAPRWKPLLRYGSPRSTIEKFVEKAKPDLLVLGTHGYAGVAHTFLGTVAGDVLRAVTCDVLVVPPRQEASGTI
ncbi:MAG TPA: universal stress protein [Labilithrix sp.]|nr:universal stress protein [Labilithrix sp.]